MDNNNKQNNVNVDNNPSKKLGLDHKDLKSVPLVKPVSQTRLTNGDFTTDLNINLTPTPTAGRAKKSVRWSEDLVRESPRAAAINHMYAMAYRNNEDNDNNIDNNNTNHSNNNSNQNPYVAYSPAPSNHPPPSYNLMDTVVNVRNMLGRWKRRVGDATRKAEDLAGSTWQHLKIGPSVADAALARLTQGTKIFTEGGYENVFRQTFDIVRGEKLQNSFACYLSTSAGPVMGVVYISTHKLAFSSDNPMTYKENGRTVWSYYKVVIPLYQLKEVKPCVSRTNPAEKYIQVLSIDNHDFWYMGFLNYESAVSTLEEAMFYRNL